jgi:hypothetical protein
VELQLGFVRQPEFPHGLNLKTQQGELKMKSTKKESKPKPEQQYVLHSDASAAKFNRGFLGAVVAFVEKKGTVDTPSLISQFSVRQFDGKKVSADRVRRYVAYCKAHGIFKVAVKASKAKKTSPVVKAAKGVGNLIEGAVVPREKSAKRPRRVSDNRVPHRRVWHLG